MDSLFEAVLFYDDLPDERQDAVREQLSQHPELHDTLVHWMQVRAAVRRELDAAVPDRHLLVLYALDDAGLGDALSEAEQSALREARPALREALDAHPGLQDVVQRIQEEQADFDAVWEAEVDAAMQDDAGATSLEDEAMRHPAPSQAADDYSWALRLVAGVSLIMVALALAFFLPSGPSTTTIDVAAGETETITLDDGTSVRLSGVTRFTYPDEMPDGSAPYIVSIQTGKAFFDVTPRRDRAFVVETPTATAEVLGTQFGVDTAPHHTDITLAEGALRIGAPNAADTARRMLAPGQATRVARDGAPTAPRSVDVNEALSWSGLFLFRQTPLARITTSLGAAYDVSIAVDETLAEEPVTGTFEREQPVGDVLDALAATLGARVEQVNATEYEITTAP